MSKTLNRARVVCPNCGEEYREQRGVTEDDKQASFLSTVCLNCGENLRKYRRQDSHEDT